MTKNNAFKNEKSLLDEVIMNLGQEYHKGQQWIWSKNRKLKIGTQDDQPIVVIQTSFMACTGTSF